MEIVGLPAGEVKESRERVRSALRQSGFQVPLDRVLINLAPAAVRKHGAAFDLAVALAILAATGQYPHILPPDLLVMGELRLDGTVLPVGGLLSALLSARNHGVPHVLLPEANRCEAEHFADLHLAFLAKLRHLAEAPFVWERGRGGTPADRPRCALHNSGDPNRSDAGEEGASGSPDFGEVEGQQDAKEAALTAAAGGHHLLLLGPPGTGKTMIAHRTGGILAPLSPSVSLEVAAIHSLRFGRSDVSSRPPVRSPHHTATGEGIIGGGPGAGPGEAALAHGGLLILDEALEFGSAVLQSLREPLESRVVRIARAEYQVWYPARFSVLMTSNLCPCGALGNQRRSCACTASEIARYWSRLGEPLLDRLEVRCLLILPEEPAGADKGSNQSPPEESAEPWLLPPQEWTTRRMATLVAGAREIQRARFEGYSFDVNGDIPPGLLSRFIQLSESQERWLKIRCGRKRLSRRGEHAVRRIARTVADLEGSDPVQDDHIERAFAMRTRGNLESILKTRSQEPIDAER